MAVANALAYYNAATSKAGAANIRPGRKGLPVANTLAYCQMTTIETIKYFFISKPSGKRFYCYLQISYQKY
jgi:hypothetical protein